jgi:Mn-dependent DtxR family transcriptional regulator
MITSGLEDYLELIYNRISESKEVKAIDIANAFNVSRASVSEALIRLADMDLIVYEGRKGIHITDKGIEEAKRIVNAHQVLANFFVEVLGVDKISAEKNACKIEHVIDGCLLEKISEFTDKYKKFSR